MPRFPKIPRIVRHLTQSRIAALVGAACVCLVCLTGLVRAAQDPAEGAPFLNTWLVLGPFPNDPQDTGFTSTPFDESRIEPAEGLATAGRTWAFFDDRLFSRNYDDYQDLFSYFRTKRGEEINGAVAYAHAYVYLPLECEAELRIGADSAFKAWLGGETVAESTATAPTRDATKTAVSLKPGWNRLLLKIANRKAGRLGFYCRLCAPDGGPIPGLVYSTEAAGPLRVATAPMPESGGASLPAAFREWAYVGASAAAARHQDKTVDHCFPAMDYALASSDFVLTASGGKPPYRWRPVCGALPEGLSIHEDGRITGTPPASAKIGQYAITVEVTDSTGAACQRPLSLRLAERPNRWYEEARLVALIHVPESNPPAEFGRFAKLMKRQGYGLGMAISYNNGEYRHRWPNPLCPDCPLGDCMTPYKKALEAEGVRFGMYFGNFNGDNHEGTDGALLLVEDAMKKFQPKAIWFDWLGWNGESLDALFSMIKTHSPDTLIVLNGVQRMNNGDWDVICLEGWSAWGDEMWKLWPFHFQWPKRPVIESWRLVADPAFEFSKDVHPDWKEYLRVQLALIGEGFVANIDHSPTIRSGYPPGGPRALKTLDDSPVWKCHEQMANWASPGGIPALIESYTQVTPGPLLEDAWGYSTLNLARDAVYVHMLRDGRGKTGVPAEKQLAVGPVEAEVADVVWMNANRPVPFYQEGKQLALDLADIVPDEIDTILKIRLKAPLPPEAGRLVHSPRRALHAKPGNLAYEKPSRLLDFPGNQEAGPSGLGLAHFGVDGRRDTGAQAAEFWAWTYEVDIEGVREISRIVLCFDDDAYSTKYDIQLSTDRNAWTGAVTVENNDRGGIHEHAVPPAPARFIRVRSFKPDGPGQPGKQMQIRELEVYAKP